MTAALHSVTGTAGARVRVLQPGDEPALHALFADNPVRHCFAEARLEAGGLRPNVIGGPFWGYGERAKVRGALLVGANMVPIATDDDSRAAFAERAVSEGRRSSSIVGPADEVLDLWRRLEPAWGPARDVREEQWLMAVSGPPTIAPDPYVRVSHAGDLDTVFPACVAMFTEEVGVSPLAGGMAAAYRRRVDELVSQGRSFARFDADGPVFKAELGAVSRRACQVQGVWVRPALRGRGLAASGMVSVVRLAVQIAPVVCLYVNSFNHAAVAAYERAGFRTVERFATVLF